jgi:hypothetical protein
MLINRRVVSRPGIHGRLQIFPTFISVQALSVFLAGWLGLSLAAAVEGASSAQQTCFHDTLQIVNNETLQSRRKILLGCSVQRNGDSTWAGVHLIAGTVGTGHFTCIRLPVLATYSGTEQYESIQLCQHCRMYSCCRFRR